MSTKNCQRLNFLAPETAGWGGGLPRGGVVVEKFVPSLESLSCLGLEGRNLGCPGNVVGISRTPGGVQKVCAKTVRVNFSFLSRARFRPESGKKKTSKHKHFGRDSVWDKQEPSVGQTGWFLIGFVQARGKSTNPNF